MAKTIRLRWEGNQSAKYDGVVQDIDEKYLLPADRQSVSVGKVVRVRWGRSKRLWRAIVVDLLEDEDEEEQEAAEEEEEEEQEQEEQEQEVEELTEPPAKKSKYFEYCF